MRGPILVTGAAGWLGSGLLHRLLEEDGSAGAVATPTAEVRALALPGESVRPEFRAHPRLRAVEGDLRRPEDVSRFVEGSRGGTLLHVAGVIHPRRVRELYEVNVDGTLRVVEAAADAGVARAVVLSSNSPCGVNRSPTETFDEESPYRPYMNYGRSKMKMEIAVRELAARKGIEAVILRAPWFYGPYQPARQTLLFRMVRDGKAPLVGSGENRRSMAYVDNLCDGILLAATRPGVGGRTYWIADERPYEMREILDTIERLLERDFGIPCAHRRMKLPGLASKTAWLFDKAIQGMGLYHQKIHVLSEMNKTIACRIDRARAELGYAPRVALEEGMRRSIDWVLRAYGSLDAVGP
jgi:nucleoside-diphosphate-sugar epimerase